ncbi:MAG TPA: carboxypeptidase-like regulatory domain-containing protein, partial [Blastocatellia bacterium]
GIYRIYGLPPGRYLVSVGNEPEPSGSLLGKSRFFRRVYYPGVSDESRATILDLKSGAEATGIDISFAQTQKTYTASGRVVDAKTGKPVPYVQLGFSIVKPENETGDGGYTSSFSSSFSTDAEGAFRIEGLMPGMVNVTPAYLEDSESYGDAISFEIRDQDVAGLVLKVHRGSSISGTLALEGTDDPEIIAKLSRMRVGVSVALAEVTERWHRMYRSAAVSSNGSFHVKGIKPGKAQVHLDAGRENTRFSILRVERGGVDQTQGLEIGPDEHIADLLVTIGYGSGRIRGRVNIEGGKLPLDAVINIGAWRTEGIHGSTYSSGEVAPDGRFVINSLMTGEYEVSAQVYRREGSELRPLGQAQMKKVSVTNGAETEITLVIDLSAKPNNQN